MKRNVSSILLVTNSAHKFPRYKGQGTKAHHLIWEVLKNLWSFFSPHNYKSHRGTQIVSYYPMKRSFNLLSFYYAYCQKTQISISLIFHDNIFCSIFCYSQPCLVFFFFFLSCLRLFHLYFKCQTIQSLALDSLFFSITEWSPSVPLPERLSKCQLISNKWL